MKTGESVPGGKAVGRRAVQPEERASTCTIRLKASHLKAVSQLLSMSREGQITGTWLKFNSQRYELNKGKDSSCSGWFWILYFFLFKHELGSHTKSNRQCGRDSCLLGKALSFEEPKEKNLGDFQPPSTAPCLFSRVCVSFLASTSF